MRVCAVSPAAAGVGRRALSCGGRSSTYAQVFSGVGKPFELREIAIPPLEAGQVLLELELSTICGSDLHTISGVRSSPAPLVLGHEGVGRVAASRRVGIEPHCRLSFSIADSCGHCRPCRSFALPQKCTNLFKYGHASLTSGSGLNGCYAQHIVLRPDTHVVVLPPKLSSAEVAPANCALATIANCLEDGPLMPENRESAVVQGAGLLGLYAVAWLRHVLGFRHVFCLDPVPARLQHASEFGAIAISASAEGRRRQIRDLAPFGVDIVLEVAGTSSVVPEGIDLLRPGGHYVMAGMVHPDTLLESISGEQIIRKCLTLRGAHNYAPRHLDAAIAFLSKYANVLPLQRLVSPAIPLSDINSALRLAASKRWPRVSLHTQH